MVACIHINSGVIPWLRFGKQFLFVESFIRTISSEFSHSEELHKRMYSHTLMHEYLEKFLLCVLWKCMRVWVCVRSSSVKAITFHFSFTLLTKYKFISLCVLTNCQYILSKMSHICMSGSLCLYNIFRGAENIASYMHSSSKNVLTG